jgi:signal transduction histidine kinase
LLLVQRNALQLQRLTDELLDIGKIENEDVVVEASNADLISIINHEDAVGALFGSSFEQQLITNKSEIPVMVINPKAITTLGGVIGT